MTDAPTVPNQAQRFVGDHRDDGVVEEIVGLLTAPESQSFFLFAGAGSGKTHTLKEVLVRLTGRVDAHCIGKAFAQRLARENRQLAVITYTNNAADEIERRLASNPMVAVSTIHTFCWRLMEGFDTDIRAALFAGLEEEIATKEASRPGETTASGRPRRPADLERMLKDWTEELNRLRATRDGLQEIDRFTYSPDQERFGGGALTHSEVIQTAAWLLAHRPTFRRVLVDRHPIVFIDESQDTSKQVLHALLALEQETHISLGLIGDHRQRIYMDGERSLPQVIPAGWARPALKLNRRCPHRVVQLINAVWMAPIDGRTEPPAGGEQYALSTRPTGTVRLYVGKTTDPDKPGGERECAVDMARRTEDPAWSNHDGGYRLLVLEHQLAADRAGFGALYKCLHRYDENQARAGKIGTLGVVRSVLLPLFEAMQPDGAVGAWQVTEILAAHASGIARERLEALGPEAQRAAFVQVRGAASQLFALWMGGDPALAALLRCCSDTGLLDLDRRLSEALGTEPPSEEPTRRTPKHEVLAGALSRPWSEYVGYSRYTDGLAVHGTHQGVKGSEFERVLVVIDDEAAAGNQFAYEKVFGAKPPSAGDRENEEAGKERTIDRTLRLLYVTCSRAKESLAVVMWTASPEAVRRRAIELGWFTAEEVGSVPVGPPGDL